MVERQEVEALLEYVEMRLQSDKVELPPTVSDDTLSALCRAWLALDAGLRVYVGRVYDCDVGEDRGEILRTLPESMIGFVRIVKEVG